MLSYIKAKLLQLMFLLYELYVSLIFLYSEVGCFLYSHCKYVFCMFNNMILLLYK